MALVLYSMKKNVRFTLKNIYNNAQNKRIWENFENKRASNGIKFSLFAFVATATYTHAYTDRETQSMSDAHCVELFQPLNMENAFDVGWSSRSNSQIETADVDTNAKTETDQCRNGQDTHQRLR